MNSFLLGLQFLTRLTINRNVDWSEKSCGKSVKFFPLIGAVLGIFYVVAGYIIYYILPSFNFSLSNNLTGFIFLILNIFLTGALHCDGFVDTMDGILSGRKPERILEIMKDSRVGAHGATCLILLLIGKFVMFSDLNGYTAMIALFLMPIIARYCMTFAVIKFPYARPQGLGKAFHQYSNDKDLLFPLIFTFLLCAALGEIACIVLVITAFIMFLFTRYISNLLGGLTGDVYGATAELGEFVVIFVFSISQTFISNI